MERVCQPAPLAGVGLARRWRKSCAARWYKVAGLNPRTRLTQDRVPDHANWRAGRTITEIIIDPNLEKGLTAHPYQKSNHIEDRFLEMVVSSFHRTNSL